MNISVVCSFLPFPFLLEYFILRQIHKRTHSNKLSLGHFRFVEFIVAPTFYENLVQKMQAFCPAVWHAFIFNDIVFSCKVVEWLFHAETLINSNFLVSAARTKGLLLVRKIVILVSSVNLQRNQICKIRSHYVPAPWRVFIRFVGFKILEALKTVEMHFFSQLMNTKGCQKPFQHQITANSFSAPELFSFQWLRY